MKRTRRSLLLLGGVSLFSVSEGEVLLATGFTARTVAARPGLTVGGIQWTSRGVDNPGDLTVRNEVPGALPGLFDTADSQGHLAPDKNVGNEGPWSVDLPAVGGHG